MELTIQHLRIVVAVADRRSFTAAGEALHLVQSSLSRTVADVERRVGVRLFERTTRSVLPTPEGQEFVRLARHVVQTFDNGMQHFSGFLDGSQGLVRIATLPSLAATLVPTLLARYRSEQPAVRFTIRDGLLAQVATQVRAGEVDLAITVDTPHEGLDFWPIAEDFFFLVCPGSHALAAGDDVPWSSLTDEPFVNFDVTSSVRAHVDLAMAESGTQVGAITEARNIPAVGGLVAAGLGLSAVPGLVLPLLEFAHLAHRRLTDPVVGRTIGILADPRRPLAPAVRAFMALARDAHRTDLALPAGARWLNR